MKTCYILLGLFLLTGCTPEPQPIEFGRDGCHYCKMTIVDKRYGAELVTKKGKIYKFDAVECLINTVYDEKFIEPGNIHSMWTIDFSNPTQLIDAGQCYYLHSDKLPSPMGMYLTAFSDNQKLQNAKAEFGGEVWSWSQTKDYVLSRGNIPGN